MFGAVHESVRIDCQAAGHCCFLGFLYRKNAVVLVFLHKSLATASPTTAGINVSISKSTITMLFREL